jgi:uncharacterized membrane protein YdbT with pleckstrin-like domain
MANPSIERGLRHRSGVNREPRKNDNKTEHENKHPLVDRNKRKQEDATKQKLKEITEEKKIYYSHPCRRGWHTMKKYIAAFIIFIASYVFAFDPTVGAAIALLGIDSVLIGQALLGLAFLIILALEAIRFKVRYYITPSRVVEERGIFSKKINSLHMSIIDTIKVKTNLIDRILNMGDVRIAIIDSNVTFIDIHNPNKVEDLMIKTINEYKSTHRLS